MIVECPKCKAVLADVEVHKPFTASVHCGMCGTDFGASLRPEPGEAEIEQEQAAGTSGGEKSESA